MGIDGIFIGEGEKELKFSIVAFANESKQSLLIYTLKNMTTLENIPFLADNPVFRYLADVSDISALSQKERQRYDESIKTMRDHISARPL